MSGLAKRIVLTLGAIVAVLALGLLITYQVIHIDWISFMEIQPSFRPMEDPLPVPARSVPIQGAAFVPETGNPTNPITADQASLSRGQTLYEINCEICHGKQGKGNGPVAEKLVRKPADLTGANVKPLSEGEIFLVITDGVQLPKGSTGGMPALRENLTVSDRWDVVNYVRSLQGQ
jgi:mono/diheme cytochrome c family protein